MSSPEKARYFFSLAQQAGLRVSWSGPSQQNPHECDWIWSHADRFLELALHDFHQSVKSIAQTSMTKARDLIDLSIVVERTFQWIGGHLHEPPSIVPLNFKLPKLVSINFV